MGEATLALIVLAAGESKRFGARNKLLHEIDGERVLSRVLDAFDLADFSQKVVVLGHEAVKVKSFCEREGWSFVQNPDYQKGMGSSLSFGVRSLELSGLSGVVVCLGDLPYLRRSEVSELLASFRAQENKSVIIPRFNGLRGHPVCFPASLLPDLAKLDGEQGGKDILRSGAAPVEFVDLKRDGCVRDLDTL